MARFKHPNIEKLETNIENQLKHDLSDAQLFKQVPLDESEVERGGYSNYSYWRSTFRAFSKKPVAMIMLCVMVVILLFTFIQPYLPGQKDANLVMNNPNNNGLPYKYVQPGETIEMMDGTLHTAILGTNEIGQDLWSRIWAGTRTSLLIAITVALIEMVVGIVVGVLWGYVRKLDFIFTEIYNVLDNIPSTLVLILISYIMMPGIGTLILAMSLQRWIGMARFVRNQILIIRDREYNLASRCLGTPTRRIILKNLLPYLVSVIMLRVALSIPDAIGSEVFIAYIGLGLPVAIPSLGNLVAVGRKLMLTESLRYQLIYPTIILSIVTVSFYVIGNAFSDASDPKNHIN